MGEFCGTEMCKKGIRTHLPFFIKGNKEKTMKLDTYRGSRRGGNRAGER